MVTIERPASIPELQNPSILARGIPIERFDVLDIALIIVTRSSVAEQSEVREPAPLSVVPGNMRDADNIPEG
jgi:hypothetical protein